MTRDVIPIRARVSTNAMNFVIVVLPTRERA
jgi:hypothetical protein